MSPNFLQIRMINETICHIYFKGYCDILLILMFFCCINTLPKVQKILQNVTVSENMFQSFNMEVYEKIFLKLNF